MCDVMCGVHAQIDAEWNGIKISKSWELQQAPVTSAVGV